MNLSQLQQSVGEQFVKEEKGNIIVSIGDDVMYLGCESTDELSRKFMGEFKEELDYSWTIAVGDTMPKAIEIINRDMLKDEKVISFLLEVVGVY